VSTGTESRLFFLARIAHARRRWRGSPSATRLDYQRQARPLAPQAADEPHPTLMRAPAAPLRKAGLPLAAS